MGRALRRSDTDEGWINRELADLRRQIRELRAEKDLEAATISAGGLTVEDGGGIMIKDGGTFRLVAADGTTIFHVFSDANLPEPDGDPQPRVVMRRADGTLAMSLDDPAPGVDGYNQILRFWDRAGNEIWAEDTTSGTGLATPWLTGHLYPARYTDWFGTTTGTFETLWTGYVYKTHPNLAVGLKHTSDVSDTSGEVRVRVNGAALGATASTGFVIASHEVGGPVAGNIGDALTVTIEARRTAGTGQVRCAPYAVAVRQT